MKLLLVLFAVLLVFFSGCTTPVGDLSGISNISKIKYFGIAQMLYLSDEDFVPYIQDFKGYSNTVALSFTFIGSSIISPTEASLQEIAEFDRPILSLGKTIWTLDEAERDQLFIDLKNIPGYENIVGINIIDEPYLEGHDRAELDSFISEAKATFPGKSYGVNFNPRGLIDASATIPNDLDYVGIDMYPCNFGVEWNDELGWKEKIQQTLNLVKSKTSAPVMYVAQGFSKPNCPLTPDNVEWSFEVVNTNGIEGIIYWFAESETVSGFTGFTASPEAEEKIQQLGRIVVRPNA